MKVKTFLLIASAMSVSLAGCGKQQAVSYNAYGVEKGAGSTGVHTVLPGDTVYTIAQNYQLPMREIITLNGMEAPFVLNTGYRMKLPPPNEHEVREGDNISIISKLYEVSPSQLVKLNNIEPPYNLTYGQRLRLPSKTKEPNRNIEPVSFNAGEVSEGVSQNARIEPVERGTLSSSSKAVPQAVPETTPRAQAAVQTNNVSNNGMITPDRKPRAQKASLASRPKLPSQTPKMSSGNGRFLRPINGDIISSFGPKEGGLHNDGINIRAVKGTPVRAAENGVVVYNGDDLEGYGNLILVRHDNKMMSAYAHLDKTLVKRGATVKRGQSIGTVGSTGQVDTPQLHFEIRKGSKALNPAKYL